LIILQFGLIFAPIVLLAILISIIFHECAHGLMAKWNGDLTAKFAKRITLNPVRHFDLLGFIMLLFVGFGYAKPIPVNPENFKNKRKGIILVSLAGIKVNLLLALVSAFFFVIIERFGAFAYFGENFNNISEIISYVFALFFFMMLHINVMLALFNILPFFPLDGHRLLEAGLGSFNRVVKFLRDWGMVILIALIGIDILFSFINSFVPINLMNFSPLGVYMRFVGGAITQGFLNLFRVMFGVSTQWLF